MLAQRMQLMKRIARNRPLIDVDLNDLSSIVHKKLEGLQGLSSNT